MRSGVTAREIEKNFSCPVFCTPSAGEIIELPLTPLKFCRAEVGDTYEKIAKRYFSDASRIRELNRNAPVYPTRKIYLP